MQTPSIPRIIHYVWIGDKPIPEADQACIDSWKRYCPGWEIRRWDIADVKGIDNIFLRETISSKKWVFVCDWLRLYALSQEGGFYMDTDVELKSSLEPFRNASLVMGLNTSGYPQTALIGAVAHNPLIEEILATYSKRKFILGPGIYDETASNSIYQAHFRRHGIDLKRYLGERESEVAPGVKIYHSDILCRPGKTYENVAHHKAAGYWLTPYKRKAAYPLPFHLRIIRMKKRKFAKPSDPLDLLPEEKPICSFRTPRALFTLVRY